MQEVPEAVTLFFQQCNGILCDTAQIVDSGIKLSQLTRAGWQIHPPFDLRRFDDGRRHMPCRAVVCIDQFFADTLQRNFLGVVHLGFLQSKQGDHGGHAHFSAEI